MTRSILAVIFWAAALSQVVADVQMPSVFGDHMVLQQGVALPVWGTAAPGEKIEVVFAGKKAEATADAQGRWRTNLAPVPASAQPQEFVVNGKNKIVLTDVLVGEVWVCSGQSNMVLSGRNLVTREVDEKRQIRFFMTPPTGSLIPQQTTAGKWHVCRVGGEPPVYYSATGYHFATEIQRVRATPVGMIESAFNGTAIQPWEELSALEGSATFHKLAAEVTARRQNLPAAMTKYETQILPAWVAQHPQEKKPGAGQGELTTTDPADDTAAGTDGKVSPPAPGGKEKGKGKPGGDSKPPTPPDRGTTEPSALFNAMVSPHIPYAIKGVLWYQGESNAQNEARCKEYAELLPLLISGWRAQWKQGDFPFLFVQLPAFTVDRPWQELRNSQFKTLSVPNTGMVVALDLNPTDNLHPPQKQEIGRRLSLLARRLAYGETLVASGPLYQGMKTEGNKIRVSFTETGGGLVLGGPPPAYRKPGEDPVAEKSLLGFKVRASDGAWTDARATIDGNTVLVSCDAVSQPAHVSYAWDTYPKANLYNKEGLPASPFRSDDAPDFTKRK